MDTTKWMLMAVLCLFFLGTRAQLYGLGVSIPSLVRINPTTAIETRVGSTNLPNELTAQQLSSIDARNRIYYLIAYNDTSSIVQIIGLSLTTGTLVKTIKLPFISSAFIGVGETCNVMPNGDILVSGRDRVRNQHQILRVSASTGATSKIASIGDVDVLGGASTYDPSNSMLWIQLGLKSGSISNFGFNISTGKLVHQIPDTLNMETMDYDPVTQLIYGIGLQVFNETSYYRILMTLDSKTGKYNIIGKIPGYFIIQASLAALDSKGRLLYTYLQKTGNSNAKFDLLTISMQDASIKNAVLACNNNCPWSIAYL